MRRTLSFFSIITIIFSLVTVRVAIKCIANFNKGLKIHITSNMLAQKLLEDYEMEMEAYG